MNSRSRPKRIVLLTASLYLSVTHLWAHAKLDHAEPAVDSTAKQSPAEVHLTFTEKVEAGFCRVQVFDASGQEVDQKDLHANAKNTSELIVSLPASLAAGTYKVVWRAVAADTHVTKGEYAFRIQP